MARLFTNGFEINSVTNGVDWSTHSGTPTNQTSVVRSGSRAGQINGLGSGAAKGWGHQFVATATGGPYYARAYFQYTTLPSVTTVIMALSNAITFPGLNSGDACLKLTTGGNVQLFIAGSQVGSNSTALTNGQWYMLELYVDGTPASGSRICRARIDGVEFAGTATATTFNNPRTLFVGGNVFFDASTTGVFYWDDVAVNDSTGSAQNSYPGSGKVITLFPDAAGDSNAWLNTAAGAGASTNYQLVDENPPNDATDLVQSVTANAQDLYNFGASGLGASDTINVVQVYSRHRNNTADATTSFALVIEKTAAGTKTQGSTILPNTTTWRTGSGNGTAAAEWPSLTAYLDPDGAAWTSTTIDSMQAGPKLVAAGTNRVQVSAVWVTIEYVQVPVNKNLTETLTRTDSLSVSATMELEESLSRTEYLTVEKFGGSETAPAKLHTLTDSFGGGILDSNKWTVPPGSDSPTFGTNLLVLPCTAAYTKIDSFKRYDARSSYIFIKGTPPAVGDGTREYALKLRGNGGYDANSFQFIVTGYSLLARIRRGGVASDVYGEFSSSNHKWLRLRESSGFIYFETSADGNVWNVFHQEAHLLESYVSSMVVTIECGFYGTEEASTGTLELVNLLTAITPAPGPGTSVGSGYGDGGYGEGGYGGSSGGGIVIPPPAPDIPGDITGSLRAPKLPDWRIAAGEWRIGRQIELTQAYDMTATFRLQNPHELRLKIFGGDDLQTNAIEDLITDIWIDRDGYPVGLFRVFETKDLIEPDKYGLELRAVDYKGILSRYILENETTYNDTQENIAWDLINDAQSRYGGDLGIVQGIWPATGVVRTITMKDGEQIYGNIRNMSILANGFDFDIDAQKRANLYWRERGLDRGVVLDYGGTVVEVDRHSESNNYANAIRQNGNTDLVLYLTAGDIPSRREGRWEAAYSDVNLNDSASISGAGLANLDRSSKLQPSYSMTLRPGFWKGPDHIWLGDRVTVVLKVGRLEEVVETRVYEIQIDRDENLNERVIITAAREKVDLRKVLRDQGRRISDLSRRFRADV